jgi:hypothetical protein
MDKKIVWEQADQVDQELLMEAMRLVTGDLIWSDDFEPIKQQLGILFYETMKNNVSSRMKQAVMQLANALTESK